DYCAGLVGYWAYLTNACSDVLCYARTKMGKMASDEYLQFAGSYFNHNDSSTKFKALYYCDRGKFAHGYSQCHYCDLSGK
ncbi:MAG: hypothetical protein ACRDBG_19735, partial [Waterburya sp.]